MFWGAPLVARELSTGTARTAWTQSVTRTRWLTTKLAITGTASIAATALLSLSATWWFTSFDNFTDDSRFDSMAFDVHGLAPIGYAAFGFTLGVLAGMIWRRTIPAMVTTLVTFVAARIAVTEWIRPNFQTPRTLAMSLNSLNASLNSNPESGLFGAPPLTPSVNDWVISNKVIDPSGHVVNVAKTFQSQAYVDELRVVIKYQPANRYWPFQIYETLLYTAAAAVLIGVSFWLLRRRSA
jgi:ABC-type transport system involved in multi-copper enzyme maturation permease subunit